ncbi:MAG: Hsp20/alpha crystallin family protein [Myxococcales bacterium]|nr:Hsp20/alpha crystallin family protein [Myxococcales bacterium]MCB9703032.1 Hsp20/alpha crystallin family protein [Myxococcales bacterium]
MSENTTIQRSEEAIAEETSGRPTVAPAVDIYENAAGYLVLADLPGVRGDAIDVRFEEGELRLSARRDLDDEGAVAAEFRAVEFRRIFKIPEDVDAGAIEADFQGGVLHLRLPKAKAAQPRKINVRASA